MRAITTWVLTVIIFILVSAPAFASNVKVENIKAGQSSPGTWRVGGMIRNLESHSIKGYVKIKFLNSRGDIIRSTMAYVNGGDPVAPGQAALFEYYANSKYFEGVVNYQVIFIDM